MHEKRPGASRRNSSARDIEEDFYDDKQERTAVSTPAENSDQRPIDVEAAKAEFESLRRTLSHASSLHRVATGQKSIEDAHDEDDFDLKHYLVRQPSSSSPFIVLSSLERLMLFGHGPCCCWTMFNRARTCGAPFYSLFMPIIVYLSLSTIINLFSRALFLCPICPPHSITSPADDKRVYQTCWHQIQAHWRHMGKHLCRWRRWYQDPCSPLSRRHHGIRPFTYAHRFEIPSREPQPFHAETEASSARFHWFS